MSLLKMRLNWLFMIIFDGGFLFVASAGIYSLLWGSIKHGQVVEPNALLITMICYLVPIIFHLCVHPFFYCFVDEGGVGTHAGIGIGRKEFSSGITRYKAWNIVDIVDYVKSPIWDALIVGSTKPVYIDFRLLDHNKDCVRFLLQYLPRDNASSAAEEHFFQKWERKLFKVEVNAV